MIKAIVGWLKRLGHKAKEMPPLPATVRRACMAHARMDTARGVFNLRCCRDHGHRGAHCDSDLTSGSVQLPMHVQTRGLVHLVAWFSYDPEARMRHIWTICGVHVRTANRTRRKKATTCLRCAARG